MHTLEIPQIKFKARFASSIDELTQKQFRYFCKLIGWFQTGEINERDFKNLLMVDLLKIRFTPKMVKKHPTSIYLKANIYQIAETINSFFEDREVNGKKVRELKLTFSRNMFTALKPSIFSRRLYGPEPYLTNCQFFEYVEAQQRFIAFAKTGQYSELDLMIACLYRPSKWFHFIQKLMPGYNGDIRQRFNKNQIERRAKLIAKLPPEVRFGCFLFFKNCEENIQGGEMEINGTMISFRDLFNKSSENNGIVNLGWVGVLYSLAESGVFGNIKETAQQNLYDVMLRLYQVIKENEKIAAKYDKNKTVS